MKKMVAAVLFSAVFLLNGCGSEENKAHTATETPEVLDVKLTGPEKVKPGEHAAYEAAVSYGDEAVTDADEVEFEVWKDGEKMTARCLKPNRKMAYTDLRRSLRKMAYTLYNLM